MASLKVTFSIDERTVKLLAETAERLDRPKSQVVREAIEDFAARVGQLSETEKRRLLAAFDELVPSIPERAAHEVEDEIAEIRRARRSGEGLPRASDHC